MKKYAYLIIAHNEFEILKRLIELIDDERNDIYIHIDKSSCEFNKSEFLKIPQYSTITFIERKHVFWADYSQIDVTLDLMESAHKNETYHYYHLLSGTDLPLKTQDEIHSFFDNKNQEFIGIVPQESYYSVRRVKYYHPFTGLKFYRNFKILKICDRMLEYIQKFIGINRIKNSDFKIVDGWTWVSVTDSFVKYLLENRSFIEKTFSKTIASDELVMQTMAYNSDFRKKIYCIDDLKKGSQRYIDWSRGKPYTFIKNDFEDLIKSQYMFARKFSSKKDNEIISLIYSYLKK